VRGNSADDGVVLGMSRRTVKALLARSALLSLGWANDVLITIDDDGIITDIERGSNATRAERVAGALLPGMANLHSHAFQRAMAGTAERRTRPDDDFWSWREAMYGLAATVDPDTLRAQATDVYRAMLAVGYTSVAEFHYIHRDPQGAWYADRAAMARALIEAARAAGIAICLLPALYAHGDVGGEPLDERRRRFASLPDDVMSIAATLRADYAHDPNVVVGVCAHSLRAVTPDELHALIDGSPRDVPVHLHIAEQVREVERVEAVLGARPVRWLLERFDVDQRWCLVHATHLDDAERTALARSGAVAGLCPTTEANLGDGLFPLAAYLADGGIFGIGSDSNVSLSATEELRWLEYGQRLVERRRIIAAANGDSCGETLYSGAAESGALACGRRAGRIAVGARADFVVIPHDDDPATRLDRWIFANGDRRPDVVYVGGRPSTGSG
jgi:formimidoylglutamate deiminase